MECKEVFPLLCFLETTLMNFRSSVPTSPLGGLTLKNQEEISEDNI